jgi:hypothetical protein
MNDWGGQRTCRAYPEEWFGWRGPELTIEQILEGLIEQMRLDMRGLTSPNRDPRVKMQGLRTLRNVFRILVEDGHTRWEPTLRDLETRMEGFGKACRTHLVRKFLTTNSPAEVKELTAVLTELIEQGYWPEWEIEFEAEVQRHARERA